MPNLPYPIYGTITLSDTTNPNNATVILRNDRTGEKTNTSTNSSGQYLIGAENLTNGYVEVDRLTIICSVGDESNEGSFLISDYLGGHILNLTLEEVSESSDLTYCQVQDVLDELGDKTTDDISYERIRKLVLRAESEIDEGCASSFKPVTVTDEIYDFDQYTSWKSPDQLIGYNSEMVVGTRNDYWHTCFNDRIKLNYFPIINPKTQLNGATSTSATTLTVDNTANFYSSGTIFIYNSTNGVEQITYTGKTSTTFTGCTRATNGTTASAHADNSYVTMIRISKNQQSKAMTDSWLDLQPQSGTGGDFIIDNDISLVTFVNNLPALGMRSIKVSYTYGHIIVPKIVEDLCVLLTVRKVLMSKGYSSQFDSIDNISLGGEISISSGIGGTVAYLNWLNIEIDRLWKKVGDLVLTVV